MMRNKISVLFYSIFLAVLATLFRAKFKLIFLTLKISKSLVKVLNKTFSISKVQDIRWSGLISFE